MPKLTIEGVGTFEVEKGTRLVLALKENGGNPLHRCGGNARCTTCRVEFLEGEPEIMTEAEKIKLEAQGNLGKFRLSCQCIEAWREISPAEVAGMLDKIKTKVLAFALQIEAEAPNAGDIESPAASIEERRVSQIFNTTINGSVQNYAAGATSINQVAVGGSVQAGDLDSLLTTLRSAGVADADLEELKEALEQDGRSGAAGMGEAVKGWLGGLAAKAALGAASIGSDVVSGVVAQAIVAYLGITGG